MFSDVLIETKELTMDLMSLNDPRKVLPKASIAVRAMIDGLYAWDNDSSCKLDMDTFGSLLAENLPDMICCGCAATATIAQAYGLSPKVAIQVYLCGPISLSKFELVINQLRYGITESFFEYYEVPYVVKQHILERINLVKLTEDNWRDSLIEYEKLHGLLCTFGC